MKTKLLIITVGVVIFLLSGATAFAQDTPEEKEWEFMVGMYLFATNIKGTNTIGPIDADLDVPFSALLDNLEGAFTTHFEAKKNDWIFIFDLNYAKVGDDFTLPTGGSGSFDFSFTIVEILGAYRLGSPETNAVDVFAGVRYRTQDLNLNDVILIPGAPLGGINASAEADWTDLVFGGRFVRKLHNRLDLVLRADGGVIGSNFTFNFMGGVNINLTRHVSLAAFYRYMNIDYEEGQGRDLYVYDAEEQGPLVGLVFWF